MQICSETLQKDAIQSVQPIYIHCNLQNVKNTVIVVLCLGAYLKMTNVAQGNSFWLKVRGSITIIRRIKLFNFPFAAKTKRDVLQHHSSIFVRNLGRTNVMYLMTPFSQKFLKAEQKILTSNIQVYSSLDHSKTKLLRQRYQKIQVFINMLYRISRLTKICSLLYYFWTYRWFRTIKF